VFDEVEESDNSSFENSTDSDIDDSFEMAESSILTPSTVALPPSPRQLFAAVGCSLVPFTSLVWCVLTPAVL